MPIYFGKEKFVRSAPSDDINQDEEIYYLEQTKEVFKDYE